MNSTKTEPMKCPFCNWKPKHKDLFDSLWRGKNQKTFLHPSSDEGKVCPLNMLMFSLTEWNTRAGGKHE